MTEFHEIYRSFAREYEAMVAVEDEAGNVPALIARIAPTAGRTVLDIGAGTGRLAMLVAKEAQRVIAVDRSAAMLGITGERARAAQVVNVQLAVCDHRALPLPDKSVDVALAGWTFGHSTVWDTDWKTEIGRSLNEAFRVLRPGAPLMIFETLGTGSETPGAPSEALAAFYAWLENDLGFAHTWIRTDYRFASAEHGAELTRFFFGDAMADQIVREQLIVLPECTGCWWTRCTD